MTKMERDRLLTTVFPSLSCWSLCKGNGPSSSHTQMCMPPPLATEQGVNSNLMS